MICANRNSAVFVKVLNNFAFNCHFNHIYWTGRTILAMNYDALVTVFRGFSASARIFITRRNTTILETLHAHASSVLVLKTALVSFRVKRLNSVLKF